MRLGPKTRQWVRRTLPALYRAVTHRMNGMAALRRRILRDAARNPALYADKELAAALERLRRRGVEIFPFDGAERYDTLRVEVFFDDERYPWVWHGGRRLYFRRGMDAEAVAQTYRRLRAEQDQASPHRYRAHGVEPAQGDVLLDIGAAEGIWALDGVEKAAHVALFEADPEWVGALERTFAPWAEKVLIVNGLVGDVDGGEPGDGVGGPGVSGSGGGVNGVTVDTVVRAQRLEEAGPMVLKIDVEGAEGRVLEGAADTLAQPGTRAIICTYHRHDDHRTLSGAMRGRGFTVGTSPGWMLFVHDKGLRAPFFRRGVIYCEKRVAE